jgi:hypothetical protein
MDPAGPPNCGGLFLLSQIGGAVLFFGQSLPGLSHRYETSSLASRNQIGERQALVRKTPIFFCPARHDLSVRVR